MCNVNVLIKRPDDNKDYSGLLNMISAVSYSSNSDADGIYLSGTNKTYKKTDKLDYNKYKTDIKKSDYVLTHQRISTSGFSEDNHQPFQDKNLVLIHNGVFSSHEYGKRSDTYNFFDEVSGIFKEALETEQDRQSALIYALKYVLDYSAGYYSIFIYDKVDKKGYYLRNYSGKINAVLTSDFLLFSTQDMEKFIGKNKEIIIQPDKLYEVNNDLSVYEITDLPEVSYYTKYYSNTKTTETKEKEKEEDTSYCDWCGTLNSKYKSRYKMYLCKECYRSYRREEYYENNKQSKYFGDEHYLDKDYSDIKHSNNRKYPQSYYDNLTYDDFCDYRDENRDETLEEVNHRQFTNQAREELQKQIDDSIKEEEEERRLHIAKSVGNLFTGNNMH